MSDKFWQFYTTSADAWHAMISDIEKAQISIDLEQFVFAHDQVGHQFIEILKHKALKGVKVRLILDSAGSFAIYNSGHVKELQTAGVQINFYNPISPWRVRNIFSWYWRDHRKILLIDGKLGYTGGVGLEKQMEKWRDTEVRFSGGVVREAQYVFNRMWQITSDGKFKRFRLEKYKNNEMRFITNSPHFRQRFYYRRLIRAIRKAQNYVYLTTPYFIPNQRLTFTLARAAKRGVDIRLITPKQSDHPIVDLARNSYYTLAMRAGIKIYHYEGETLHAKTVVIDDNFATVGSSNLDNLSLLFNYEANLVSINHGFVAELKDHFVNDLLNSTLLDRFEWQKRSKVIKFIEFLTWPFHSLM
ncbi:MAG: phospholipase D-like domain-containing protein [bacterium]